MEWSNPRPLGTHPDTDWPPLVGLSKEDRVYWQGVVTGVLLAFVMSQC